MVGLEFGSQAGSSFAELALASGGGVEARGGLLDVYCSLNSRSISSLTLACCPSNFLGSLPSNKFSRQSLYDCVNLL